MHAPCACLGEHVVIGEQRVDTELHERRAVRGGEEVRVHIDHLGRVHLLRKWPFSMSTAMSHVYSTSTACLQLINSWSAACLSMSAAGLQHCLQHVYNMSEALLQLVYSPSCATASRSCFGSR